MGMNVLSLLGCTDASILRMLLMVTRYWSYRSTNWSSSSPTSYMRTPSLSVTSETSSSHDSPQIDNCCYFQIRRCPKREMNEYNLQQPPSSPFPQVPCCAWHSSPSSRAGKAFSPSQGQRHLQWFCGKHGPHLLEKKLLGFWSEESNHCDNCSKPRFCYYIGQNANKRTPDDVIQYDPTTKC